MDSETEITTHADELTTGRAPRRAVALQPRETARQEPEGSAHSGVTVSGSGDPSKQVVGKSDSFLQTQLAKITTGQHDILEKINSNHRELKGLIESEVTRLTEEVLVGLYRELAQVSRVSVTPPPPPEPFCMGHFHVLLSWMLHGRYPVIPPY